VNGDSRYLAGALFKKIRTMAGVTVSRTVEHTLSNRKTAQPAEKLCGANLGQGELTLPAATTPAATSSIVLLRTSLCYLDGSFIYCLAIELVDGL